MATTMVHKNSLIRSANFNLMSHVTINPLLPKMAPRLSNEVEMLILSFSKEKLSCRAISNRLKQLGFSVSFKSVSRVINNTGKRRQIKAKGLPSPPKKSSPKSNNSKIVKRVQLEALKENPLPQKVIGKKLGVSASTVNRIIKKLGLRKLLKQRVQKLNSQHKKNRKTNSRWLYEHQLAGKRSEFVVTLDEALFGLHNCNGKRKFCYIRKGETVPEDWVIGHDNFFVTHMVIGGISGRGTLPLIKVPQNVKINSRYYIDYVLKPYLEKEIPRLYPGEEHKVFVHHDKATSHTSRLTQAYGRDLKRRTGITLIENRRIAVKSPDISPLDFFGFGFLKRRLQKRRPSTPAGFWKTLKQEWSRVDLPLINRVYLAWKRRLLTVHKRSGNHIEQTKTIHLRCKRRY